MSGRAEQTKDAWAGSETIAVGYIFLILSCLDAVCFSLFFPPGSRRLPVLSLPSTGFKGQFHFIMKDKWSEPQNIL